MALPTVWLQDRLLRMVTRAYTQPAQRQDWETPQALFDQLHREFHFTLDVCASKENAKCRSFYIRDALSLPWNHHPGKDWSGWWWCNPPYGRGLDQWITKGVSERRGVMLVPARTDTRWFHDHLWDQAQHQPRPNIELRFLKGRLKFVGASASAPFPSLVIIIR